MNHAKESSSSAAIFESFVHVFFIMVDLFLFIQELTYILQHIREANVTFYSHLQWAEIKRKCRFSNWRYQCQKWKRQKLYWKGQSSTKVGDCVDNSLIIVIFCLNNIIIFELIDCKFSSCLIYWVSVYIAAGESAFRMGKTRRYVFCKGNWIVFLSFVILKIGISWVRSL